MQLYFNGKPLGAVSDFTYQIRDQYAEVEPILRREAYVATAECTVPVGAIEALFPRAPAGASHATLVKRMRYGGRKGRSARRRLMARALPIVLTTGYLRYRGRAAFLDETEAVMVVKSVGVRR